MNESDNKNNQQNDALKNIGIMNDEDTKFGIPNTLFFGGIGLSLVFCFMLRWWTGLAFAIVWFLTMYEIHKDDPHALKAWINAAVLKRCDIWTSGTHKQRIIYLLGDEE